MVYKFNILVTHFLYPQYYIALGTIITKGNEDENVEVCFDEEENEKLGPSQYQESDLDSMRYFPNSFSYITNWKLSEKIL